MREKIAEIQKIVKQLHCDDVPKGWCHDDELVLGIEHCNNCEECVVKSILALIAPKDEALKEMESLFRSILSTANIPFSVKVDAKRGLVKIDAVLEK